MIASLTTTGSSTHGTLYELDAIAAVIIGGTLLTGGRGTLIGSILGVLVFTTITNLFILNNLATEVQNIAKGLIIVAAVLFQSRARRADTVDTPPTPPDPRRQGGRRCPISPNPVPRPRPPRLPRRRARASVPAPRWRPARATRRRPPRPPAPAAPQPRPAAPPHPGRPVTIGFSAPAADHGWIAAIARTPRRRPAKYPDVTFAPVNPTNDITQQIAAIDTLINQKVDALVILPNDGSR